MKNNKGITLIIVIMTVVLLAILAGLLVADGKDTYQESQVIKFEAYMKVIQKKVDLIIEEYGNDLNFGSSLTDEQKDKLSTIINDNPQISTRNVNEEKLRYFSSNDIENDLELSDIEDEIIINFANRDVISLNGVEKDNVMHYVEYTLY